MQTGGISERQPLQGLFGDGMYGLSLMNMYVKNVLQAMASLQVESPILTKYYNKIILERTKSQFRLMLKYLCYILLLLFFEAGVRNPGTSIIQMSYIFLTCAPIIISYMITMRNPQHETYVLLSFVLCLFFTMVTFWCRSVIVGQGHGLYSSGTVLFVCMFNLLPLRISMCLCIAAMYISCAVALVVFHATVKRVLFHPPTRNITWMDFDMTRLLSMGDRTLWTEEKYSLLMKELMCWVPIALIALYIRFWTTLRRRFAFYRLGKNVQARQECEAALRGQVHWIEAIMPSVIRSEYQDLRQKHINSGMRMWVFNKAFDNVSILFADIVGFTRMSSNKTAHRVVTLLNNLFNRFDELCEATSCEKIGTLGDCYYCISGCPIPQDEHPVCCIEMGLGMCRIIKVFNCDFGEAVSMRIGVHTGRVNAAIIGAQRFRFDVYSYDVIIASALESSGRAGRVHISIQTYELVKHLYNVSEGEPLIIKKEQVSGIAGMELTTTSITTYFVDPRSSQWRTKHENYGKSQAELRSIDHHASLVTESPPSVTYTSDDSCSKDADRTDPSSSADFSWRDIDKLTGGEQGSITKAFDRDLELIYNLQTDPEKQYTLFYSPPLWPFLMMFYNRETEWHYHAQIDDSSRKVLVDSLKVALLGDVIVCFLMIFVVQVNCYLCKSLKVSVSYMYHFLNFLCLAIASVGICCLAFSATTFHVMLSKGKLRRCYDFLIHPVAREVCTAIISLMPTFALSVFISTAGSSEVQVTQRSMLSAVGIQCILIHCAPMSSLAWARFICACISATLVLMSIECNPPETSSKGLCASFLWFRGDVPYGTYCTVYTVEVFMCVALVFFLTRENEVNCRLCFYVTREVEIASDEAEKAVVEAQELLYNIIPRYVHRHLQLGGFDYGESRSFSYAVTIQNAGVAFATISNFFSSYYREDYKGGENALKLLNSIVCMLDALLEGPIMKDVEKIKTINDCYMVAAGLNTDEVAKNQSEIAHLVALMEYCHLIIESLDAFNDMYIIGADKFEVKIGYNTGPLIAGVIGITKPMYDIWGNTVNVASRMYSTGLVGKIQVPDIVADALSDHFKFTYRGEIFVKGKGDMKTYICEKIN